MSLPERFALLIQCKIYVYICIYLVFNNMQITKIEMLRNIILEMAREI